VPYADMPSQRFAPVAAIQANHIVVAHGLPHRHGRGQNFLGLNALSKLTKGSMYRRYEFGNLIGRNRMMPHVAHDNLCRQMRIEHFVVHGTIRHSFFLIPHI
jgi:hypothetical protein